MRINGSNTVDHVIPLELGGSNKPYNLTCLCQKCNLEKGAELVLPSAYYFAMSSKECRNKDNLVICWAITHLSREDLEQRPFVFDELSASQSTKGSGEYKRTRAAFRYEKNATKYLTMYKLEEDEKEILERSLCKDRNIEEPDEYVDSVIQRCCIKPTYVIFDDTLQRVSSIVTAEVIEDRLSVTTLHTVNQTTLVKLMIDISRILKRVYLKKDIQKVVLCNVYARMYDEIVRIASRCSAVWFDYGTNCAFLDLTQKM